MADSMKAFTYDETLLAQGKYREWFYQGLDESNLGFLRAPVKTGQPAEPDNYLINYQSTQVRDWTEKAACKDADPLVFFTESHYPKTEYMKPDAQWRQYCPQCPVRESCLQAARESESVGIWAGKLFVMDQGGSKKISEYDDTTVKTIGRPRKLPSDDPKRQAKRDSDRRYRERKKENAGI